MDLKKFNQICNEALEITDKDIAKNEVDGWLQHNFHGNLDEASFTETMGDVARDLGYKIYGEYGENSLVLDVKGRPNIDLTKVGLEQNERATQHINFSIEQFANDLHEQDPEFVIHGRMGGYWGYKNAWKNFELNEEGKAKLLEMLEKQAEENTDDDYAGSLEWAKEQNNLDGFFYDLLENYGQEWMLELNDKEYFTFSNELLEKMKSLSDNIDDQEKFMNTEEYWQDFKDWEEE